VTAALRARPSVVTSEYSPGRSSEGDRSTARSRKVSQNPPTDPTREHQTWPYLTELTHLLVVPQSVPRRRPVDDSGDDNADDNPAPRAQCRSGSQRRSRAGESGCVLLEVTSGLPALVHHRALDCHRLTAVLTATSSTVPHSNTTRRTPHAHVARSDQGPACIC
jgi:hypothetical protein